MSALLQDAINRIQAERGWNDATMLYLCLEHAEGLDDGGESLVKFLKQRAKDEEEEWDHLYNPEEEEM